MSWRLPDVMADTVLYSADDKVGIVTLNRPEKLNALSMDMRLALARELKRADEDAATSVIVLRAEGRSFCVGFDVGGSGGHPQPWRHDAVDHADLERALGVDTIAEIDQLAGALVADDERHQHGRAYL